MTPAQRERWRIHREHCPSRDDEPCWGPATCRQCREIENPPASKETDQP